MPFKAIDSSTKKPILSLWFKEADQIRAKHPSLECPCCGSKVSARGGESKRMVAHFFHIGSQSECPITAKYRNVTDLTHHTLAVNTIYEHLKSNLLPDFDLDIEHFDPAIPDRVSDIAKISPDGKMIEAHEVQLTKITIEELQKRSDSYEMNGVEVVWWFGKGCQTEDVKLWAMRRFGYYSMPSFDFFTQEAEVSL
jgi:competence CoiA-like predicted nuclease